MRKVRILFPEVEAGLGHIMPLRAVAETFEKKYGDKVDVVRINFYKEANTKKLNKFQNLLIKSVKHYSLSRAYGYWETFNMQFWGITLSNWGTFEYRVPGSSKEGREYLESLNVDAVFSTHWATNYYAEHIKENKPLTIMYCPDVLMNNLFMYRSDLYLISFERGYNSALKKYKHVVNKDNLKLVPFLIRNEAFDIPMDKKVNRRKLGLPEDKFTIVIAEGGYGIGKLEPLCEKLTKEHLPITVIAVCGKNQELVEKLSKLEVTDEVTFIPLGFTTNMLEYQASCDLFCGKSGNIIAEPTFFGHPSIITNFATTIEKNIGKYYLEDVGCAIKEFEVDKIIELIKDFVAHPEKLKPYEEKALKHHDDYGAEATADIIYDALLKKYPSLTVEDKGDK